MSEIQAQKKIEEIESFEKREKEDISKIAGDLCPVCGQRPISYPYICFLPSPYGWIECSACGNVYAPKSIRDQKLAQLESGVAIPGVLPRDTVAEVN